MPAKAPTDALGITVGAEGFSNTFEQFGYRKITQADLESVAELHERQNERPANRVHIEQCITKYPSTLCLDGDHLAGFVYATYFAPDILKLTNMLVDQAYRGQGVGSLLMADFEEQARLRWTHVILTNSDLWSRPERQSPRAFYVKNGYSAIFETEHTAVLIKALKDAG